MAWMPKGQELWNFIKPYNPQLLTSPSRNNTSRLGKNLWVRNNLNPKPKVNFEDGRNALIIANAAYESYKSGRVINIKF